MFVSPSVCYFGQTSQLSAPVSPPELAVVGCETLKPDCVATAPLRLRRSVANHEPHIYIVLPVSVHVVFGLGQKDWPRSELAPTINVCCNSLL